MTEDIINIIHFNIINYYGKKYLILFNSFINFYNNYINIVNISLSINILFNDNKIYNLEYINNDININIPISNNIYNELIKLKYKKYINNKKYNILFPFINNFNNYINYVNLEDNEIKIDEIMIIIKKYFKQILYDNYILINKYKFDGYLIYDFDII